MIEDPVEIEKIQKFGARAMKTGATFCILAGVAALASWSGLSNTDVVATALGLFGLMAIFCGFIWWYDPAGTLIE